MSAKKPERRPGRRTRGPESPAARTNPTTRTPRVRSAELVEGRPACTIDVTPNSPPEHLFRQLVAAYLGGAREIVVVEPGGIAPETRGITQTFGRRLIQPEVVAIGEDTLVLRDLTAGPEPALPTLLHRMFEIVHGMQRGAGAFLDPEERADPARLLELDDEVDRLAWVVERSLLTGGDGARRDGGVPGEFHDSLSPLLLARALERVGDHAVMLGENAARLAECRVPDSVTLALRAYHRQALDYLTSAFEVAEHPEVDRSNDLIDTGEALLAAHATLTDSFLVRDGARELSPLASACLGLVLQSIDRTAAYAQDIAQVGLDRAIATRIQRGPGDHSVAATIAERSKVAELPAA